MGRVDFLIIEADSVEHHLPKYQSDRTRDRVATAMGYLMIRLTYEDVVYHWDTALADIPGGDPIGGTARLSGEHCT